MRKLLLRWLCGKGGEEMMAMLWAQQIMLGKKTFAQVPKLLKDKVAEILREPIYELIGEGTEEESAQEKPAPTNGGEPSMSMRDQRLVSWFRSLPEEKQKAILVAQDAPEGLV